MRNTAAVRQILSTISRAGNIICDFDGVIADSEEFQASVWKQLLRERGLSVDNVSVRNIAGISDRQAIEDICPGLSPELYDELVKEKKSRCARNADQVQPVPGIRSFLESVRGRKALFICSSSPAAVIEHFLKRKFGNIRFEAIVGKGDYPRPKPDPAPYLRVLERGGIRSEESIVIEDSDTGVQSAMAAGLPVVQLDRYGLARRNVPAIRSASLLANWEGVR